jgi:predicted nucleic acid-binding protein
MPNVIADTSPIQYLYQTNLLDLLPNFYGQIIVPYSVTQELAVGKISGISLPDVTSLSWISIHQAKSVSILPLVTDLGKGEKEVLALATEITDSLALLDDGLARRYARLLGIKLTGTLGILLKAKQNGYLSRIEPILNQLELLKFRLDAATRSSVLKLAGEG